MSAQVVYVDVLLEGSVVEDQASRRVKQLVLALLCCVAHEMNVVFICKGVEWLHCRQSRPYVRYLH